MASAVEDSYGSLPPAHRAALEIAKHGLLQQSEPKDNAHNNDEQQQLAASYRSHVDAPNIHTLVPPDSLDAHPSTLRSSSSNRRPRLSSSNSEPAAEFQAMVEYAQSPRGSNGMAKAASFTGGAGHYSDGGDTQPLDSQAYHRYTESMRDEATSAIPSKQQSMTTSPETMATDHEHTPQQTLQPGQTGYVDLDGMWQDRPASPATSFANYDELLVGDGVKSPDTQFYQPYRPTMPVTPALAGQKHGRDGEPLTSVTTATKYSQILPKGAVMGATQLFAQTQEHSSPFGDGQPSDDAMTRPSPNTNRTETNDMSSPRTMLSSPGVARHVRSSSGISEPRAAYTSMKESQEQRERRLRQKLQQEAGSNALDSDSEDDTQQRKFRAKQLRRSMSEQALKDAARVTAPPRGAHLLSSTRKSVVDLVTPATMRRRVSFDDILEEAEEDEGQAIMPEDQSNRVDDDEHDAGLCGDDDQYDELQEKVIRSQSNLQGDEDDEASIVASSQGNGVELPNDDGPLEDTQNPEDTESVIEDDDLKGPHDESHNTQGSTIADSQPLGRVAASKPISAPPVHHSSMASFIPGSQYTGETSQDQAFLSLSHPSQIRIATSQAEEADKVPSSPPLPRAVVKAPADSVDSAHKPPLTHHESSRENSITPQEVPDSDAADQTAENTDAEARLIGFGEEDSHNHIPFSTAQTHVSASARSPTKSFVGPSPLKAFRSQQNETPRKAFCDMIDGPQTMNASFDFVDVDDVMAGVMTKEDEAVLAVLASPRSKRMKTAVRSSPFASKLRSGYAQFEKSLQVNLQLNTMSESSRTMQDPEPDFARPALPDKDAKLPESRATSEVQGTIPESEPDPAPSESREIVPRDSPSKANVLPVALQQQELRKPRSLTPDSAEQRERAGSRRVSQLISTSRSSVPPAKKGKLKMPGRAAQRNVDKAETARKRRHLRTKSRQTEDTEEEEAEEHVGSEEAAEEAKIVDEINRNDVTPPPAERVHQAVHENDPPTLADPVAENVVAQQDTDGSLSVPERVWALFRGTPPNFYPATWLGTGPDGMSYKIRFDDGTVTNIEAYHVRILTLRIGDQVKVDHGVGSRSKNWRIVELGSGKGNANGGDSGTDTAGNTHIQLQATSSRQSVPNNGTAIEGADEVLIVPVSDLYLTNGMWKHYKDRVFSPPAPGKTLTSLPGTPSSRLQSPDGDAPSSRSRRSGTLSSKPKKRMGISHLRDASVASSTSVPCAAIFSGMAFAITYISDGAEKAQVTRMILRNGGIILEEGFGELFDIPNIGESVASPAEKTSRKHAKDGPDGLSLKLKSRFVDYGFVALIANRHSRRAKYMQALALDLPTISGRWIIDSLNEARNVSLGSPKMAPLPWSRYLLPAGESSFLGGAIRSRLMVPYDVSSSQLRCTVQNRPLLLNHEGVLIVAPRKDKGSWERRKTFAFLTFALGAGMVERVNDLQEAQNMIQADPNIWKWIYVDEKIDQAFAKLRGKTAGDKKRKRASETASDDDAKLSVTDGSVTVVNDEFVVQSLILGALAN